MRVALWPAIIALTAATAAGGLWLTARRIAPRQAPSSPVSPDVEVKFERITVRGRAHGDRRWELEARTVELTKDRRLARLQGLRRATLYADGQPQLYARAEWAQLESPAGDIQLGGGVELTSPRGLVLRARSLRWHAEQERLDSAGPVEMEVGEAMVTAPRAYYLAAGEKMICGDGVEIRQQDSYLSGDKLTADLAAETLDIEGGVRMRLRVEDGREFTGAEGPLGAMRGLLEKAPKEGD